MMETTESDIILPFSNAEEFLKYLHDCPPVPKVSWADSMAYMKENSFVERNLRGEFEKDYTFTEEALIQLKDPLSLQNEAIIPGLETAAEIPKSSSLLASDMFKLFQIFLRLNKNENLVSPEELQYWNDFSQKVKEEQDCYMSYASMQWLRLGPKKQAQISPQIMRYVNSIWKMKLDRIYEYPIHYGNPTIISIHDDYKERCKLAFQSNIKQIGKKTMSYFFPNLKYHPLNAKSVFDKLKSDVEMLEKDQADGWPKYKRRFKKLEQVKYHPDVSKDEEAKTLAYRQDVQFVASSSAISSLVNIVGPESSWSVPVVVKEVDGSKGKKKIIFLDKKLPPTSMTVVDRQKFFMKKAVKKLFLYRPPKNIETKDPEQPSNPIPKLNNQEEIIDILHDWSDDDEEEKLIVDDIAESEDSDEYQEISDVEESQLSANESDHKMDTTEENQQKLNTSEAKRPCYITEEMQQLLEESQKSEKTEESPQKMDTTEEKLEIAKEYIPKFYTTEESQELNKTEGWHPKFYESEQEMDIMEENKHFNIEEMTKSDNPKKNMDSLTNSNDSSPKKTDLNYLIEYNLWTLNSMEESNVLLKKAKLNNLRLIIRTTYEGRGRVEGNEFRNIKLSPKLEYQPEFGAEIVTLRESLRDWSSLLIRRDTALTRVRVNPMNGEVLQVENKTIATLTSDCQRLHEINPYDLITRMHIILSKMTSLPPGNYILNHEPESHQCVTVYNATDNKQILNLRLKYGTVNTGDVVPLHAPFLRLDTNIVTPVFYHFRRLPCCFAPKRNVIKESLPLDTSPPRAPIFKKKKKRKMNSQ